MCFTRGVGQENGVQMKSCVIEAVCVHTYVLRYTACMCGGTYMYNAYYSMCVRTYVGRCGVV